MIIYKFFFTICLCLYNVSSPGHKDEYPLKMGKCEEIVYDEEDKRRFDEKMHNL